jgi:hypothetical protein
MGPAVAAPSSLKKALDARNPDLGGVKGEELEAGWLQLIKRQGWALMRFNDEHRSLHIEAVEADFG